MIAFKTNLIVLAINKSLIENIQKIYIYCIYKFIKRSIVDREKTERKEGKK